MRQQHVLTVAQRGAKRGFDLLAAAVGLFCCWPLILVGWCAATWSTGRNGFFVQQRIGRWGQPISVVKLRTMRERAVGEGGDAHVTTDNDPRITPVGRWLRKSKLDELPQLWNVLVGQMSFVGPRPDVAGFADQLQGEDRVILSVRPGITGPASLYFRNEEEILASQTDPLEFNRRVIWPAKVELNRRYLEQYSLVRDLVWIWQTLAPSRWHLVPIEAPSVMDSFDSGMPQGVAADQD